MLDLEELSLPLTCTNIGLLILLSSWFVFSILLDAVKVMACKFWKYRNNGPRGTNADIVPLNSILGYYRVLLNLRILITHAF
jgi:hypothetical protein